MTGIIRVLVVDDSAFVRKVVAQMLSRSPFIEIVGVARDGAEALEMCARLSPDVITLDLVMPNVDGLEFLRRQMAIRPIPVIICSISHESGASALEAFEPPVLVIWDIEGRMMPNEHGRRLAEIFPNGRLVELPDCYTLIPEDQPVELANSIRDWLEGQGEAQAKAPA